MTLVAGEALAIYRRVKLDAAGAAVYADAADHWIGVTQAPAAITEILPVRLRNDAGTFLIESNGTIAVGADVFTAADGMISPTGDLLVGSAREAGVDDQQVEVLLSSSVVTPDAASVTTSMLANAVADQVFATTVAVANTPVTPDGGAHITGQVQDAQGNSLTGSFLIYLSLDDTVLTAPSDLGAPTALANSLIMNVLTTDAVLLVRTHTDGSWGVELDTASDGNVAATATVLGKFASATAAITGN